MSGKQSAAFLFGIAVGAAVAYVALPGGRERVLALKARAAGINSLEQAVSEAERVGRAVVASVEARFEAALTAARESRHEAQLELWQRFDFARRQGHLPPAS